MGNKTSVAAPSLVRPGQVGRRGTATPRWPCGLSVTRLTRRGISPDIAVEADGLIKSFKETKALKGVSFQVPHGKVLGVLGPNGAGKTTAVRILATLLRPDGGRASVAGFDVATQPREVRKRVGLTGQYASVDEELTGRENLRMIGEVIAHNTAENLKRVVGSQTLRVRPVSIRRPPTPYVAFSPAWWPGLRPRLLKSRNSRSYCPASTKCSSR